jgi:hypothetical protein
MTGAIKPGPRGELEGNRKTVAQEMPGDSGEPVVDYRVLSTFAHGAMGAPRARHFLRLLVKVACAFFRWGAKPIRRTRAQRVAGTRRHIPTSSSAKADDPVSPRCDW